jgi:hypothetical protein
VAEGWISYTLQRECKGLFDSLQIKADHAAFVVFAEEVGAG